MPYPPFFMFPPCKIKFLTFLLGRCHVPLSFLATDSHLLKDYQVFSLEFFLLPSKKNSIKNKAISIKINGSNYWPLSCSPLLKNVKTPAFWGNMTKGITVFKSRIFIYCKRCALLFNEFNKSHMNIWNSIMKYEYGDIYNQYYN